MRDPKSVLSAALLASTSLAIAAHAQTPPAQSVPDPARPDPGRGDAATTDFTIRVNDARFRPEPGVAPDLAAKVADAARSRRAVSASAPPGAHVVIQFFAAPTDAVRREAAARGIVPASVIDPRTWLANVTPEAAQSLQRMEGVRWADVPPRALKLSPLVRIAQPYAWQLRGGGRIAYAVGLHKDVGAAEIAALASSLGAQLEGFRPRTIGILHSATFVIDPARFEMLLAADIVRWVEPSQPPDIPDNQGNVQPLSRVDVLQGTSFRDSANNAFTPTGQGITAGVWEAQEIVAGVGRSAVRASHVELAGRVTFGGDLAGPPAPTNFSDHATHVAGTIASSGANLPLTEGMAPSASIESWSSADDATEMAENAAGGTPGGAIRISNHSYGPGVGWNDAGSAFSDNQDLFGQYGARSEDWDDIVIDTGLIVFKSAGNDRNDQWDTTTATPDSARPRDCTQGGLGVDADCIAAPGTAKNVLTIGSMANAAGISGFSSFGPTDDRRIKPDLVARGSNVLSLGRANDNATATKSGTSMATPAAAGIAALLLEIADRRNIAMSPAAMKALMIETAIDVVGTGQAQVGPDYATGWGIVDALAAANLLGAAIGPGLVQDVLAGDGPQLARSFPVYVPSGLGELRVTLAWSDPAGSNLINNLDLRLVAPDGTVWTPWRLDPASPGAAAVRNGGDENDNNVEQVSVLNPARGVWQARVTADTGTLGQPPQAFALAGPLAGFGIVSPTQVRTALGGGPMWGSRVLVRLAGSPGIDLSRPNVRIEVGGTVLTDAQIPTLSPVGGETWAVIAPGPKAVGCYDLRVSLLAPAGMADTEQQAICYNDDATRKIERIVAVDRTNSMRYDSSNGVASDEKLNAAKAAAKFFVDLSNPDDQIGVVSFQRTDENGNGTIDDATELSELLVTLRLAGDGATDNRPTARAVIDGIFPNAFSTSNPYETSIGGGLRESVAEMAARARADGDKVTVMVTDGRENYPPYWRRADAGPPMRDGWDTAHRIDTIGIGGDADDDVLEDMASFTNGTYLPISEGQGSFGLLSRLASYYKTIDEDIRGEQRFFYAEGDPAIWGIPAGSATPGIVSRRRVGWFKVEPALDWMTVAFHANVDGAAGTALFDPDGIVVTGVYPSTTSYHDPKHITHRIRTPKPGIWTFALEKPLAPGTEYFATASGPTSLSARVGPSALTPLPASFYAKPLRVWIADGKPITGAVVTGFVRRPDKVKMPVALLDNGVSDDGRPSDGIYGFRYIDLMPGAYYVELQARGVSSGGEPFERYLSTSFVLPGKPPGGDQVGEGGEPPGRTPGRDCKCDPGGERRWMGSVFGGIAIPEGGLAATQDPGASLGVSLERQWTSAVSLGLYLGRDGFPGKGGGPDRSFLHLSGEVAVAPWTGLPVQPSIHVGAGLYRDQAHSHDFGVNIGLGLRYCITKRVALLGRFDNRHVDAGKGNYATVQLGLRVTF